MSHDQSLMRLAALAAGNAENEEPLLDAMLAEIARAIGVSRAGIWLLDPRAEWLVLRALHVVGDESTDVVDLRGVQCPEYFRHIASGETLELSRLEGLESGIGTRLEVARSAGMDALLDVPLFMGGQWIGVLFCEYRGGSRHWSAAERTFLGSADDLVALVLEAERYRSGEQQQERQHARLRALSDALRSGVTIENEVGRVVHANPVAQAFMESAGIEEPVGMLCEEIVKHLAPLVAEEEGWSARIMGIIHTGEPVHGMPLHLRDGREFEVDHVPVNDDAGQPLGHIWQYHEVTPYRRAEGSLRRQRNLYHALSEMHRGILHSKGIEFPLELACRVAVEYAGLTLAWIGEVDPETLWVKVVTAYGKASDYARSIRISADPAKPEGRGPGGRALNSWETVVIGDIGEDRRLAPWHPYTERYELRSVASIPMPTPPSRGPMVFNVYAAEPGYFDSATIALVEGLAGSVVEAFAGRQVNAPD
ncbi:GAF domain-containing protein [Thiohalospira halophila DSM 15071]|uniref:GAF domain-containing protein n=1 Tax=Thiohalospira halophila DSM 15071 TaxID=1123397 RepID=A0A1I1Q467_9GAMM|nr:GAF domain-containing protein [Thiohalospira halophila]SFD16805.1 GAF domain-containing protein [Thiohalospira halophila DSM 15071]